MFNKEKLLEGLNAKSLSTRCKSLKKLLKLESFNSELAPVSKEIVPLHFSSNMYYSSYSPTLCAYLAHKCGCFALAVNDYVTVSSYKELKKACEILKMPYACGYHVYTEPLFNEKKGVVFGYGVANVYQKALNEDLKEIRLAKLENVKKIIKRINKVLLPFNLSISEREVIDKKKVKKGGSVTEKDVAKHLAEKLVKKYGKGEELLKFLKDALRVDSCEKELPFLIETENTYFVEDLTKVIYLNYQIFQSKTKNKVVDSVLAINKKYGIISSYKIDIKTYDEKELDLISTTLLEKGFNAVSLRCEGIDRLDLDKIIDYFYGKGILTISLYRLGMPRQFVPLNEASNKLYLNGLAVIGSAISSNCDCKDSFIGENTVKLCPNILKRVELFSNVSKKGK